MFPYCSTLMFPRNTNQYIFKLSYLLQQSHDGMNRVGFWWLMLDITRRVSFLVHLSRVGIECFDRWCFNSVFTYPYEHLRCHRFHTNELKWQIHGPFKCRPFRSGPDLMEISLCMQIYMIFTIVIPHCTSENDWGRLKLVELEQDTPS